MASSGKKKKGEDGATSGGADYATFKKPAKLDAEDDLVSYLRSLEQPLIDLLIRVEEYQRQNALPASTSAGGKGGSHKRSAAEAGLDGPATTAAFTGPHYASVACLGDADSEACLLVKGVYRELSRREASLTSHKRCSEVLELLLRLSTAAQLARFATAIAPYIPFLSFNRYGSHVLQTLLGLVYEYLSGRRSIEPAALACVPTAEEQQEEAAAAAAGAGDAQDAMQLAVAAGASSEPEAVRQVLLSFVLGSVRSLGSYLHASLYHDSATHVMRSLICLLSGLPPAAAGAAGTASASASSDAKGKGGKAGEGGKEGRPVGGGGTQTGTVDSLIDASCTAAVRAYGKAQGKQGRRQLLRALVGLVHAVCAIGGAIDVNTGACDVSTPAGAAGAAAADSAEGAAQAPPKPPADLKPFLQSEDDVLPLEELGALCCDVHASATMQTLLAACAHAARGTAKVLARRMLNITLKGLTETERDGSVDYSSSKGSKAEGEGEHGAAGGGVAVPEESTEDTWAGRLITHAIGSRVVELLLATVDAPLFDALLQRVFSGQLASLCADGVGNFTVQRLLLCCRSKEQTENVLRELLPHVGTLSAPDAVYGKKREGVLLHMVSAAVGCPAKRAASAVSEASAHAKPFSAGGAGAGAGNQYGLLTHAPAAHGQGVSAEVQKLLLNALAAIVSVGPEKASVIPPSSWYARRTGGEDEEQEDRQEQGQGGAVSAAALSTHTAAVAKAASDVLGRGSSDSLARLARYWLDINGGRTRKGGSGGAAAGSSTGSGESGAADHSGLSVPPINLSPTGVRLYAHLLHLHPSLVRQVAESVLCLKPAEVLGLACEPSASRHIIEPMIEGRLSPATSSPSEWAWIVPKLYGALQGHFAALSVSRFGCWTVTKMAQALQDGKKRGALAAELLQHERAVTGSASGRTVWRSLRMDHCKGNAAGWEASWARPPSALAPAGTSGSGTGNPVSTGPQTVVQARTAALLQDILPAAPPGTEGGSKKGKGRASEEEVQKAVEAVLGPQGKRSKH